MVKMKNTGLIDASYVKTYLQKRDRQLHKGSCGKLLVVAGSHGMAGACVLCARGALRTGAGLVQVSVPDELYPVIHGGVVEATCVSRRAGDLDLNSYQAIAVGPGLGVGDEQLHLIETILKGYEGTVVLDADGLNLLAKHPSLAELTRQRSASGHLRLIITPHPGEAGRLLGISSREVNADRQASAKALAAKYNAVAVLKGAATIVATPSGETYTNPTGNPGMATGGSGDVLTGVIVSLAGQGLGPCQAACCGVYLHGLAGDLAAQHWGEYGLLASDMADHVALAIRRTVELEPQEDIGV